MKTRNGIMSGAAKPMASPPAGVSAELHRVIMRRIDGCHLGSQDACRLMHDGPGLAELAGLIPLMRHLDGKAVLHYALLLDHLQPLLNGCMRCEAMLFAVLHLVLQAIDPDRAMSYLLLMLEREYLLAENGCDCDFLREVQAASRASGVGSMAPSRIRHETPCT